MKKETPLTCTPIVVLGQQLKPDGTLTEEAQTRVLAACLLYKRHPSCVFLFCGGQTRASSKQKPYPSEAFAMKMYAENMLGPIHYILEERSTSTCSNARYAKTLLQHCIFKKIILVTSDYHMKRAKFEFTHHFPNSIKIHTKSSSHHNNSIIKYFNGIREYVFYIISHMRHYMPYHTATTVHK